MGTFRSFQHQKREPLTTSPSSLAQPARPFVPIPLPSTISAPHHVQGSVENTHRFGHAFERLSIFPPEYHASVCTQDGQQRISTDGEMSASGGQRVLMRTTRPRADVQSLSPPSFHPFATRMIQRQERDER